MTNTTPALSVVMPAYNAEDYIGRAIESILNQSFGDLELIIGEDRSTDTTWQIIQDYASRDDRIKVFRNDENSGAAATINKAVAMAVAPVIAGMDADDISVPHRMERQIAVLRNQPEIAVVGSYVSHVNEDDEILSLSQTGPTSIEQFEDLRRRGEPTMVFGGTAMYEKRRFDEVGGYDATLRAAADIEFCDRMAEHGPIVALPEPLLLYRVYSTSNVMLRFREGRRTHRFLEARRAARLAGEPLPTRAEYVAQEQALPWWRRLNIRRDDFSQYHYRQAGLAYGEGRKLQTAVHLLIAGVTGPLHVLRRVWDQRLSPEARRARAAR
ncbi:MAG: glycosyltransferase [Acidimicrobiia bacterium]|nr:glycosyltransferase [Acidimicrobiia bacterium]